METIDMEAKDQKICKKTKVFEMNQMLQKGDLFMAQEKIGELSEAGESEDAFRRLLQTLGL